MKKTKVLIDKEEALNELQKLRRNLQMLDNTQAADKILEGVFLSEKAIKKMEGEKSGA